MKKLLPLLFLLPGIAFAQTYIEQSTGSVNYHTQYKGGIGADKTLKIPVTDVTSISGFSMKGLIKINASGNYFEYHNGISWIRMVDSAYIATKYKPINYTPTNIEIQTSLGYIPEPLLIKNTAFNKNFGNAPGTVAEGNDSRIVNAVPYTRTINGHSLSADIHITKSDVDLGNVDNTPDISKPISSVTQAALNNKVDKISGKQLSTEDYTSAEKTKLASIKEDYTNTSTITSSGNVTFYLTNDKTSTGTALFSNVSYVCPLVNDSTVNYTYQWTTYNATTKSITVNVKATPVLNVSALSLTLLGVPANAANGTPVQVLIKGN